MRWRTDEGETSSGCSSWPAANGTRPNTFRTGAAASRLALPTAVVILLPIGGLVAAFLHGTPLLARDRERPVVFAVEQDDDPLVRVHVGGQTSAFYEEANGGVIRICGRERQQDGLLLPVRLPVGAMGKEAVICECPQVIVERRHAFVGRRLHDGAPAPLPRFLQKRRQDRLERLSLE